MDNRLEFHEKLCALLGSRNCYFQPPSNIRIEYPCIVYHEKDIVTFRADNIDFISHYVYRVNWITSTPDIDIPFKMKQAFHHCALEQIYPSDNLMHYAFTITIPRKIKE